MFDLDAFTADTLPGTTEAKIFGFSWNQNQDLLLVRQMFQPLHYGASTAGMFPSNSESVSEESESDALKIHCKKCSTLRLPYVVCFNKK